MHPARCALHLALLLIAVIPLRGTGVSPVAAPVTRFTGKVVAVHDGDTISVLVPAGTVLPRGTREEVRGTGVSPVKPASSPLAVKVRLEGIDCPELAQPYGKVAKLFTSEHVFGRQVQVTSTAVDRYGRIVGRVTVDGRDLSEAIVSAGLAWHYTEYSRDLTLDALERAARASRRGLWAEKNPVPPWVFRRGVGTGASGGSAASGGSGASTSGRGLPVAPVTGPLHGNPSSRLFHEPGCPNYNCKNCTAVFATREQALAAGYKPAGDCRRR
jgi:endonuclease YncB( thermonuclease family)